MTFLCYKTKDVYVIGDLNMFNCINSQSLGPCLTLPFADKDKTGEDAMDLSNT